jgi:uncharacterized protein (DUF302 family)
LLQPARRIALAAAVALALTACEVDDDPVATDDPAELEDPATDDEPAPTEEPGPLPDDLEDSEEPDLAEDPVPPVASGGFGVLAGATDASVDESAAAVEDAIADGPAELAFDVDHAQQAAEAGLELLDTRLLLFGDPEVGTPLMQQEPLMGLDLPAKLLIWEAGDGRTLLGVNDPVFLAQRHGVDPGLDPLVALDETQRNLLEAAGATGVPARLDPGNVAPGIEVLDSDADFDETLDRARDAVDAAGVELVAEIDHAEAAQGVGMELPDSTLLVFGNPEIGSQLMAFHRSVGIDLPQKLLVYDDDGQTRVAYNDPLYLRSRHLLAGLEEPSADIGEALAGLADAATGR